MNELELEMKFAEMMSALRGFYPNTKIEDRQWDLTISAYYALLKDFGPDIWQKAVPRVVKQHPNFMPTAPNLLVICEGLAKTAQGAEMRLLLAEGRALDDENPLEQVAQSLEEGRVGGALAAAAIKEAIEASGSAIPLGNTLDALQEKYGPIDENAFCPSCGQTKLNHGLLSRCHMKWGSKHDG